MKETSKFYDRIAPYYFVIDLFLKPYKKTLKNTLDALPSGKLLEVGVGNGKHLRQLTGHQVIAIDTSSKMLEIAARNVPHQVCLKHMDGTKMTFSDGIFDYISLAHIVSVADQEKLLGEAHRVLKPGGKVFVLNHFTPNNGIQYIDRIMHKFSRVFHYRSLFLPQDLKINDLFTITKEEPIGKWEYYKLIELTKK